MAIEGKSQLDKDIRTLWRQRKTLGFNGWHGFSVDDVLKDVQIFLYVESDANTKELKTAVSRIQGAPTPEIVPMKQFRRNKLQITGPLNLQSPVTLPTAAVSTADAVGPPHILPGSSVSASSASCPNPNHNACAGTIATFLRRTGDASGGPQWILSNHHVLVKDSSCLPGVQTFSLGRVISTTDPQFVPLVEDSDNNVDAAIALLDNGVITQSVYPLELSLHNNTPVTPHPGPVAKFGSQTGITSGKFLRFSTMNVLNCSGTKAHDFSNQMLIQSSGQAFFSCKGDSGSLVVQDGGPVGLLFANEGDVRCSTHALATPFQIVLDELQRVLGIAFEMISPQPPN